MAIVQMGYCITTEMMKDRSAQFARKERRRLNGIQSRASVLSGTALEEVRSEHGTARHGWA